jgi:predicted DNA-binding transcriptional regulator AlpA
MRAKPKRHHLDRRISQIRAAEPAGIGHNHPPDIPPPQPKDDDLLTCAQVAAWLGVSVQWLEAARAKGFGPAWMRLGPRAIRYPRGGVKKFLTARARARAKEVA